MMPRTCANGHDLYFEDHSAGDALILRHGDYECTRYWAA
jgi:pimeloyl-ACP methyl ester carboxylesterase